MDVVVNKFISGLSNPKIKFELVKDTKITKLDEALKQGQLLESLLADSNTEHVNQVGSSRQNKNRSWNNKTNHKKGDKKGKEHSKTFICNYCKKPGHFKKDCYKLQRKNKQRSETNEVEEQLGSITLN